MPRSSLVLVLALGCGSADEGILTPVAEAWASQTASAAGPSVTTALLLAALNAEVCVLHNGLSAAQIEALWATDPLDPTLFEALGQPRVSVEVEDDGRMTLLLSDAVLGGATVAAEVDVAPPTGAMAVSATLSAGRTIAGSFTGTALAGCAEEGASVRFSANLDGAVVAAPPEAQPDASLDLDLRAAPYVPRAGTLTWTGTMDGEARSFTPVDGSQFKREDEFDELPFGTWAGTAKGKTWSAGATLIVAP